MEYSICIQFQTSIVNMEEAKSLTINNQPRKYMDKKNGASMATQSTYVSPQRNALQGFPTETQKGISQQEAKKAEEYALVEADKNALLQRSN